MVYPEEGAGGSFVHSGHVHIGLAILLHNSSHSIRHQPSQNNLRVNVSLVTVGYLELSAIHGGFRRYCMYELLQFISTAADVCLQNQ